MLNSQPLASLDLIAAMSANTLAAMMAVVLGILMSVFVWLSFRAFEHAIERGANPCHARSSCYSRLIGAAVVFLLLGVVLWLLKDNLHEWLFGRLLDRTA